MKRSCASSAESRGNPWKDVFAARISTAKVKIWTTQYIHAPVLPTGKTARATCETTESVLLGRACRWTARYETPRNIVIATTPRTPSVRAAFFACGRLKALTPFAIASTPVSALAPDAKALSTRKIVRVPTPAGSGFGVWAIVQVPTAHFVTPTPIITSIETMKRYVGSANVRPDSRTPR